MTVRSGFVISCRRMVGFSVWPEHLNVPPVLSGPPALIPIRTTHLTAIFYLFLLVPHRQPTDLIAYLFEVPEGRIRLIN